MTQMKTIFKSLLAASALSLIAVSFTASAEDAAAGAKKPAKEVSCAQEAKNKGIKDKAEKKAFVKECEEKRKAAHAK
jgi:hypothetical protein